MTLGKPHVAIFKLLVCLQSPTSPLSWVNNRIMKWNVHLNWLYVHTHQKSWRYVSLTRHNADLRTNTRVGRAGKNSRRTLCAKQSTYGNASFTSSNKRRLENPIQLRATWKDMQSQDPSKLHSTTSSGSWPRRKSYVSTSKQPLCVTKEAWHSLSSKLMQWRSCSSNWTPHSSLQVANTCLVVSSTWPTLDWRQESTKSSRICPLSTSLPMVVPISPIQGSQTSPFIRMWAHSIIFHKISAPYQWPLSTKPTGCWITCELSPKVTLSESTLFRRIHVLQWLLCGRYWW